mgnify:CR=1 FL=1
MGARAVKCLVFIYEGLEKVVVKVGEVGRKVFALLHAPHQRPPKGCANRRDVIAQAGIGHADRQRSTHWCPQVVILDTVRNPARVGTRS